MFVRQQLLTIFMLVTFEGDQCLFTFKTLLPSSEIHFLSLTSFNMPSNDFLAAFDLFSDSLRRLISDVFSLHFFCKCDTVICNFWTSVPSWTHLEHTFMDWTFAVELCPFPINSSKPSSCDQSRMPSFSSFSQFSPLFSV